MRTARTSQIRVDFFQSAPEWTCCIATELTTGRKAQATAGTPAAARRLAIDKLKRR